MNPVSKKGRRPLRTIREIAREVGVSTATVSRVLNNPESVSSAKRDAVLRVIEQNDYVNDGMARALSGGRTMTIGLVIPTITNSIYASSTHAIQRLAQKNGYAVILVVSDFDAVTEKNLIRRLVERRVDGIILTGGEHDPGVYRMLERNGVPCVLTWRLADSSSYPCVSFDNYAAGRLAMDHLLSLGHRRIGLICGRSDVNDRARERRRSYEDAMTEAGLDIDSGLIFERDFEFVEGQTAMSRMLITPEPPTAVFAANDIQAVGALSACRNAGLRVPEDISIVGFDDLPITQFSAPQLTTLRVPAAEMGHRAATRLLQMIDGAEASGSDVLPVQLIVRESTAEIKHVEN
ncbi:LacI family DNA-binding transcriptional regulator [Pikeienuella sp. HZG-20]|uniref:LacI family DNA-binding transcriptional regulator n=1 Tax=Paludibacillus litoralis TaxID=3133267 RepID=UPI0030EF4F18